MFKPLLAAKAELDCLTFPMIASPKIDGIRCLIDPRLGAVTRTMKAIPNTHVRHWLNTHPVPLAHLDGELVTYTAGKIDDFNTVQSKIMSGDGAPDFKFHVFDTFRDPDMQYVHRVSSLLTNFHKHQNDHFVLHNTCMVYSAADLTEIEAQFIDREGWEGVMLRRPDGPYKFGRSTAKEGVLLKLKRFEDDEAVITGAIERMHNGNEARQDAFGRTERSSHKANLVPTGTLGALSVRWLPASDASGNAVVDFEIGTGFDDSTRASLWAQRDALIGRSVTFKFQGVGSQGAPRFPVFLGLRSDLLAAGHHSAQS